MKQYKLSIELLSDTLSGSGEGFGAVIDSDAEYDEYGIPNISAKRIKGALRNSLDDILDMPYIKKIKDINTKADKEAILDSIFGKSGASQSSLFEISNLTVDDYESVEEWFKYLINSYPDIYSCERIISSFTNIRKQTRVNSDGIAENHSLRSARVVNKKLCFSSDVFLKTTDNEMINYIALAAANLRRIGVKRNRGLGKIKCELHGVALSNAIDSLLNNEEGK